ncbi:uncharacterized protein DUF5007 [Arcticibacter tournemirensis]|uniref:DUF5007 domain-containing protein n=1 Tax=Arcticibacter tournemirensis TaxID=699437 RepID=A0A5M9GRT6_9SPHI|nr:DUF5007 domain-containing protein [Arcticibacter tournemirensis]KAA8477482.1 DUF5007 domain-containing protein [Arcticibacter tournemirensis]TQM51307.1 uncharacterized protein DUF5007 [Arcticibacter tournemirensis]
MRRKRFYIALAMLACAFYACSKIEPGFISDNIRYVNGIIFVQRGMAYVASDRIEADGSTPPYTYKLSNLRDKTTGEPAPAAFYANYDVLMFKEGMVFNAQTDTTVELLNAKRHTVSTTPMIFNESSGQFVFNRASANLPLGNYVFDIEMTNPHGTKLFKNMGEISIVEPTVNDMFQVTYQAATGSSTSEVFTSIAAPQVTCSKIGNDGARVILKIVDKNGVPFNPAAGEVIKRGDRPTFESHVKFNPVVVTDTALVCDYEVAPFPLTNYNDGVTDWGYLIYYRIPKEFAIIDGLLNNNVNPVFGFRLLMEGTYIVTIRLPAVTRLRR